jgi:hypothetical protein
MVTRDQKFELLVDFLKTTMLPVVEYELQKLEAEQDDANLFWANTKAALTARLQEKTLPAWLKERWDLSCIEGLVIVPVVHAADNFGVMCVAIYCWPCRLQAERSSTCATQHVPEFVL